MSRSGEVELQDQNRGHELGHHHPDDDPLTSTAAGADARRSELRGKRAYALLGSSILQLPIWGNYERETKSLEVVQRKKTRIHERSLTLF